METKQCTKCKRILPKDTNHFSIDKSRKDGFYHTCKECRGHHFIPYVKEGYKVCSKCKRELPLSGDYFHHDNSSKDTFRSSCRECDGKSFALSYKICSKCGRTFPNSKEYFRTTTNSNKKCTCKNCYRKYHRSYDKTKNGKLNKVRTFHNRNAAKNKTIHNFTKSEWEECLKFFDYKDAYTGLPMEIISQDHIIPVSKGGSYTKQNIVPCERRINSSKSNTDMGKWYKLQPFYSEERLNKIHEWMGIKDNKQQLSIL